MNLIINKYWKTALIASLGAAAGFAYWRFVGCSTGTCPLTSNWHTSTLMGGLIGLLAAPNIKMKENTNQQNIEEK